VEPESNADIITALAQGRVTAKLLPVCLHASGVDVLVPPNGTNGEHGDQAKADVAAFGSLMEGLLAFQPALPYSPRLRCVLARNGIMQDPGSCLTKVCLG
jgi:hypothetical protein